uniref:RNA-directed RNA polymerase n=1 Tax=Planotaenium ohtanii toti-like virus TaxID=2933122 RepID=A0A9C7LLN1_9VIRU|nr:RNA-dependent RNA polymerase [Planotaenium ohtanii toti-like virus]CAI5383898.1 RNA-dependent RNA polymerase [Planotaenium ohtanii toti-like virus]
MNVGGLDALKAMVDTPLMLEGEGIAKRLTPGQHIRAVINEVATGKWKTREAWIKQYAASGISSPQEADALGLALRWPDEEAARVKEADKPNRDDGWRVPTKDRPKWFKDRFGKGEKIGGEILQLTLTTVCDVLARELKEWEMDLLWHNTGYDEWSVAAMLLGLNQLHPEIVEKMNSCGMFKAPLPTWKDAFKPWFNAHRRAGTLVGCQTVTVNDIVRMRKMLNCTYRSKEEPNWTAEYDRRVAETPLHWGFNSKGQRNMRWWYDLFNQKANEFATQLVSLMNSGPMLDTLDTWWKARWATAPAGSSSMRKIQKDTILEDSRLSSASRANKKAAWEALPNWFAGYTLACRKPFAAVRASSKPEPGGKQRALYATDDESQIIAAYSSVNIEKFMNFWGIRAKQAPADVAQWLSQTVYMKPGYSWLSIDFSDYNTEHSLEMLVGLNLAIRDAWLASKANVQIRNDKARTAWWVADAHLNTIVTDAGGKSYRMIGTLCSGHRDTARDNSSLHGITSKMVVHMMREIDDGIEPLFSSFTGDDEDSLMRDTAAMAHYVLGHHICGFALNPAKQQTGWDTHEYLQRQCVPGELPYRPLFAMLAQLASGNWYKDVHIWYDSAIQSVSDNVWELHSRGMDLTQARKLAAIILNATMRVPTHHTTADTESGEKRTTQWKQLEWWAYRHGQNYSPLWLNMPGPILDMPVIDAKPLPPPEAARLATEDWIKSREQKAGLKLSKAALKMYTEQCLKQSYAAMYLKPRADAHRQYAREEWPSRTSNIPWNNFGQQEKYECKSSDILNNCSWAAQDRRPKTLDELLSRIGLDAAFVDAAGGLLAVLTKLPPSSLAKFENPVIPRGLPMKYRKLDTALQSWLATAYAIDIPGPNDKWEILPKSRLRIAARHAKHLEESNKLRNVHIVYTANARIARQYCRSKPNATTLEEIIRKTSMRTALKHWLTSTSSSYGELHKFKERVGLLLMNPEIDELASHMDPDIFIPKHTERSWTTTTTILITPTPTLKAEKRQEGWSDKEISTYLNRWDTIKNKITKGTDKFRNTLEKNQLKLLNGP